MFANSRLFVFLMGLSLLSSTTATAQNKGLVIGGNDAAKVFEITTDAINAGAIMIRVQVHLTVAKPTVQHHFSRIDAALAAAASPNGEVPRATIIVDLHDPNPSPIDPKLKVDDKFIPNIQVFVDGWKSIADRYKNFHEKAIRYELLNEPLRFHGQNRERPWRAVALNAAKKIREVDNVHRIMFAPVNLEAETSHKIHGIDLVEATPLVGIEKQSLVFHMWDWGDRGDLQDPFASAPPPYPSRRLNRTRDHLKNKIATIAAYSAIHNVPVYLSEVGVPRHYPDAARFLKDVTDLCDEFGVHTTIHAFRDASPQHDVWNHEHNPLAWQVILNWLNQ